MADQPNDGSQWLFKDGIADRILAAYAAALFEEGTVIMGDSQENYCPIDHGILHASGHVSEVVHVGNELQCTLSYGGAAEAYAMAVHEHLSDHSPYSWRVHVARGHEVHFQHGGPKYLELPVLAAAKDFTARVTASAIEKLSK